MKRFLCILLTGSLLLCPLSGCGKKKDAAAGSAPAASGALTQQKNDTMHLNMLFSLIGTPDIGVTELLGDGENQKYGADGSLQQRTFEGTVYGADITFDVHYDEYGDVSDIAVSFPSSISRAELEKTVTELVDRKPSADGSWQAETAVVTLDETDGHVCMMLKPFSGGPEPEETDES